MTDVDRRAPGKRSLMIENSVIARWALAVNAADQGELATLWDGILPSIQQLAELWLAKSLQRDAQNHDPDLSPIQLFIGRLENRQLRFRGGDELWRLAASVALSRVDPAEQDGLQSSSKFAGQVACACRPLLDELADADLESVALFKLNGSTNDEIAETMDCTRRTIQRMLKLIREIWASQIES